MKMSFLRITFSILFKYTINAIEKMRVLPMVIFMCGLSFSFKIGHSLKSIYFIVSTNEAFAFEDDSKKRKENKGSEDDIKLPRLETSAKEIEKITKEKKNAKIDLMDLTPEAIKGLHDMANEQNRQEERAESVQNKEELLKLHEQRLDEKLGELKKTKKEIEQQLQTFGQNENEKTKKLIEMLTQLPPKQAGPILEYMDVIEIAPLLESMKENKSAAILKFVSTEKAAKIIKELMIRLQRHSGSAEKSSPKATESHKDIPSNSSLPPVPTQ
jgi:flagellar motility protein MotE (MotC chaperone)